jgi:hypothetical protein
VNLRTLIIVACASILTAAGALAAADNGAAKDAVKAGDPAPLGSTEFYPSVQHPVGWRSDGSGKYPAAHPPLHWGRVEKRMLEFKCAAAVPRDGSDRGAAPASEGFFTEWLVAGPVKCKDHVKAIKEELIPGEAALTSVAGDRIGDAAWKVARAEDSYVDLSKALGKMTEGQAAYAQSCLYVDRAMKVHLHMFHSLGVVFWFNGAAIHSNAQEQIGTGFAAQLDLKPGWNRFL